jgi:phosphoserine phosphatase RsbU/P
MKKKTELTAEIKYHLLKDISHKIRGTLDLDKILTLLLDLLSEIIHYDAAGIFILKENINYPGYHSPKQKIAGIAQRGFGNLPPESDTMLMEGKGIIGHTIKTGKGIILPNVNKEKRYIAGRKESKSEITSPIFRDGKTIGALNVESDKLDAFTQDDIKVLDFFAEAASISIEMALLHYRILENKKIEEQLQLAKNVQLGLLPTSEPEIKGYQFSGICIPTFDIGGDYFDYIYLDENRLAILVADVSGDGIPAALIMAAFRALLRYNAKLFTDPAELMKVMNQHVSEFMRARDFISVFYGILDHKNHKLIYSNCGHNPSLHLNLSKTILLEGTGPSLNLVKDAEFLSKEIYIGKNDKILFYTDGVTEVFNEDNEQFGLERLKDLVVANKDQAPDKIIRNIILSTKTFCSSDFYSDDFTLLALKRID